MKDNGCRLNFQLDIQPLLINTKLADDKYFFKAYETFVMLSSSAEVDEKSDLKNIDIMRLKSLSQSLLFKIL